MAFEYNGFVYRDLEPQVRYDAEQIQALKQADVEINEKIDNYKPTKYVTITPASATSGTISSDNLSILQDDGNNILVKNNRYYRQTQTNGSIMYYTAVDNGITYQVAINTDSLTWEYSEISGGSDTKLYRHTVQFYLTSAFASTQEKIYNYAGTQQTTSGSAYYTVELYTTSGDQITDKNVLYNSISGSPFLVLINKGLYYGHGYFYSTSLTNTQIYGELTTSSGGSYNFILNMQTGFISLANISSDTVTEM